MSDLLRWRRATSTDKSFRQRFSCAIPAKPVWNGHRSTHPAPHELEVQTWLRNMVLRPGQTLVLGMDAGGIGAAAAWVEGEDPSGVLLQALAVANRHRHQGGAHAREAMSVVLTDVTSRAVAAGMTDLVIEARIHTRNAPSKSLCAAVGFEYDGLHSAGLERWVRYTAPPTAQP